MMPSSSRAPCEPMPVMSGPTLPPSPFAVSHTVQFSVKTCCMAFMRASSIRSTVCGSLVTQPPWESPKKTSAPTSASSSVRAAVAEA